MGGVGGVYHFLKKKPYNETRDLFNEIRKDEIARGNTIGYFYVSAAPSFTFDAQEWITKNNLICQFKTFFKNIKWTIPINNP